MPARAAVVWGTWAVLTIAGLGFVAAFGRDCPYMDEWGMLSALAGDVNPVRWAWEPHSEHRYPVPRLVYLAAFRLTGDLRSCMVLSVLLLSASAAVLVLAARQVRGGTSLADLFFPLAFLHAGHWENLLMAYQVGFTLPVSLASALIYLATRMRADAGGWIVAGVAVSTALLPGCGGAGVILAVPAAGWLVFLAYGLVRRRRAGAAVVAGFGAFATLAILGLLAATYPGSPFGSAPRRPMDLAGFAARLTAMTFGPLPGWLWPAALVLTATCGLAGFGTVVRGQLANNPFRTFGFLAALAGGCLLVVALTWGRSWGGAEAAVMSRYSALLLPGAAACLLLILSSAGRVARVALPTGMTLFAAAVWPLNLAAGLHHGSRLSAQMDALTADVRDGLPADLVAERYDWQLFLNHPRMPDQLAEAARIGFTPFRNPGLVLVTRTVPVTAQSLSIAIPPTPDAVALRIRGEFIPAVNGVADYRVRWREAGTAGWREERFQVVKNFPAAVVVRVMGPVSEIEITPDQVTVNYRVTAVELVVAERPANSAVASAGSR